MNKEEIIGHKEEILSRFLSYRINPIFKWVNAVIPYRQYSYATNGQVICRTKGRYGSKPTYVHPRFDIEVPWGNLKSEVKISPAVLDATREKYKCQHCDPNGNGIVVPCWKCDADDDHCDVCNGRGYTVKGGMLNTKLCPVCYGTQIAPPKNRGITFFGGIEVDPRYLAKVIDLPDVHFCLPEKDMLGFLTPDFEGFIMGIRW